MTKQTEGISAFTGRTISCTCGHTHAVPIKQIAVGTGAVRELEEMLKPFSNKSVFLMGDQNTMALGRDAVAAYLKEAGCRITEYTFSGEHLVTDEKCIGSVLTHMAQGTALIAAVGSGTMNDVARVVAARCGIPYIIIATAPSMDGYASSTSAVVMDGGKKSLPLKPPYAIVCDLNLIKTAPDRMLAAGAGDILGKYIAVRDWQLASRETEEYYCPYIADLVLATADRCAGDLPVLFSRNEKVLERIMSSLVMAGITISMYGTSRPAAGMEHQMAHAWEVDAILSGVHASLHGNYVGLAALAACRLYELAASEFDLPGAERMPPYETMKGYMRQLRGYSELASLSISREAFRKGILYAAQPHIRYTLASYLRQQGKIEAYADRLTGEFFA